MYLIARISTNNGGEFDDFVFWNYSGAPPGDGLQDGHSVTLTSVPRRLSRFPGPWLEAECYSRRVQESLPATTVLLIKLMAFTLRVEDLMSPRLGLE
jgi:hypothetical protein